jgi:hypothetical protein
MRRDARNQAAGTSYCRLSYQIPEQASNEMSISGILVAMGVLLEGAYTVKLQIVKFSCEKPASNKTASGHEEMACIATRRRRYRSAQSVLLRRTVEDQCRSNSIMTTRLAVSANDVDNKVRNELSGFMLRSSLRNPHPLRRNIKRCDRVTPKSPNASW